MQLLPATFAMASWPVMNLGPASARAPFVKMKSSPHAQRQLGPDLKQTDISEGVLRGLDDWRDKKRVLRSQGQTGRMWYLLFGCKGLCSIHVKRRLLSLTSAALLTLKEKEKERGGGGGGGERRENGHTVASSCFCVYEQRRLVFEGNPEQCSNASCVWKAG